MNHHSTSSSSLSKSGSASYLKTAGATATASLSSPSPPPLSPNSTNIELANAAVSIVNNFINTTKMAENSNMPIVGAAAATAGASKVPLSASDSVVNSSSHKHSSRICLSPGSVSIITLSSDSDNERDLDDDDDELLNYADSSNYLGIATGRNTVEVPEIDDREEERPINDDEDQVCI